MGALIVAFFVFVIVPALALAALAAGVTFGWKAIRRLSRQLSAAPGDRRVAAPKPATVVAFPGGRAPRPAGQADRVSKAA